MHVIYFIMLQSSNIIFIFKLLFYSLHILDLIFIVIIFSFVYFWYRFKHCMYVFIYIYTYIPYFLPLFFV